MNHTSKIATILLMFFITSCGLVNNIGVMGKNIAGNFSSHPYSVDENQRQEILDSGKAIVSIDFGTHFGTAWRHIDENGNIEDKDYTLTYNNVNAGGRRISQIPAGTYFLNGVQGLDIEGTSFVSGYYLRSIDMENFGWDEETKKAKCFSFTVKAGEELEIPRVFAKAEKKKEKSICPTLSIEDNKTSKKFYIGAESK